MKVLRMPAFAVCAAVGLLIHLPVFGDTADLDTLVVTADRSEQRLGDAIPNTTVLTREDIELSAAVDVVELLRLQPGLDIARSGGPGQQTSIFLRGTNSNQVLVLIDGLRASSVHTGAFAWEHLPLAQVERIEIVRGPRASLYGSDAVGGVIQIFTRRVRGAAARLAGGSFSTLSAEGAWGFEQQTLHGGAAVGYYDSGGFSAQNASGFSFDPDDDGYRNTSFSGNLGGLFGDDRGQHEDHAHTWSVNLYHTDGESEFDQGVSDARSLIMGARVSGGFSPRWSHNLTLGYQSDDLETPVFGSMFETERLTADWVNHFMLTDAQHVTAGLNYYDEQGISGDGFSNAVIYEGSRDNLGLFGLWRGQFDNNTLEASLRYDDNSEFGSELTGALAWAYEISGHTRISTSLGSAFRAPTLSEQLSPGFGGLFAGNPDLTPETAETLEFGIRSTVDSPHWWSASLYATDVDDLIDFSGMNFQAVNINKAEIRGLEASYGYARGPWSTQLNLTLQSTENQATGQPLSRRPDEKLGGTLSYRFDNGARIGAEAFYSGDRLDIASTLGSYWLVNLSGQYPVAPRWTLEARIENLLDDDYELAGGFNTPELSGFLGLRWRPDR